MTCLMSDSDSSDERSSPTATPLPPQKPKSCQLYYAGHRHSEKRLSQSKLRAPRTHGASRCQIICGHGLRPAGKPFDRCGIAEVGGSRGEVREGETLTPTMCSTNPLVHWIEC